MSQSADSPSSATGVETLFEQITGQSTLTERQNEGAPVRFPDRDDPDVSAYVAASIRADGLDDAIADPDE